MTVKIKQSIIDKLIGVKEMAKKVTEEILKERIKSLKDIEYLGGYIKMHDKIKVKCLLCNNEWNVIAKDILSGKSGCPECAKEKRLKGLNKKKLNYLEELIEKSGEDYTWLENYNHNNKQKILIRHNECGHEYLIRPNDFQQGYRCPECSRKSSLVERKTKLFLDENNIDYEIQKSESINGRIYNYDFYISDLKLYIELDGEQHFRRNSKWFKNGNTRTRDLIKNNYIENKNYNLLRIPYHNKKQVPQIINLLKEIILNNNITEKIILENNCLLITKNSKVNLDDYYAINESMYPIND